MKGDRKMNNLEKIINGLNTKQREAATQTDGKFLVLASAGSGKTAVLTKRVSYLIALGISPWEIVAVTFTKKAANEIRERVQKEIGESALDVNMGTFHSLCMRILLSNQKALGMNNLTILDEGEAKKIIADIAMTQGYIAENDIRDIQSILDGWSNEGWAPEDVATKPNVVPSILAIYEEYVQFKRLVGYIDFNDILSLTAKLFRIRPDILEKYSRKFRYIMVDEAQDLNNLQFELLHHLSSFHHNFMIIADDLQAIYSFRGSNVNNIMSIREYDADVQTILLEQNYRSSGTIVRASNAFISHNKNQLEKVSFTENDKGWPLYLYESTDETREADFIVATIKGLMKNHGYDYSDFAVIYRSNYLSRTVELALSMSGIPYDIVAGSEFYEREEIKTLVSYLRALDNPMDDLAYERILNKPKRGIGDTTINRIKLYATEAGIPFSKALEYVDDIPKINRPTKENIANFLNILTRGRNLVESKDAKVSDILNYIILSTHFMEQYDIERSADLDRIQNIQELKSVAINFDQREREELVEEQTVLTQFLTETALYVKEDKEEDPQTKVSLTTAHSSKGLEYKCVFVIGVEAGIFPSRMVKDEEEFEEERRLFYVSMTRVKELLFISYNANRYRQGQIIQNGPSRFLGEIPIEYIRHLGIKNNGSSKEEQK